MPIARGSRICFFFVNNCIVLFGFIPGWIHVALPRECQLGLSHTAQPTVHAGCFSVSRIHQAVTWTTGSLKCLQMLTHAMAQGRVRTLKESLHWKWTQGEKSLAAPGNQTCISGVLVWCSANWATSPPISSVVNFSSFFFLGGGVYFFQFLFFYCTRMQEVYQTQ